MPATITASFSIDGGPPVRGRLEVDQHVEWVRSERATRPDPAWEFTDDASHWHAFAKDGELPTLRGTSVQVPCDGSCGGVCGGEGYTVVRYTCRACDQEVQPNYLPDWEARTRGTPVLGLKEWSVQIEDAWSDAYQLGKAVSVRHDAAGTTLFGIGAIANLERTFDGTTDLMTATIAGTGPLGQRLTA